MKFFLALQISFVFLIITIQSISRASPLVHQNSNEDGPIIQIENGLIQGSIQISRGGRNYMSFLSIPYARPPIGPFRFEPPVEPENWDGIRNATFLTPQCIQKDKYNPVEMAKGSEDCLYLNVYTPKTLEELNSTTPLPVMLYIHGGGPTGNASRYRGDYLMDQNVIFITMHFRLGLFGNLNTKDISARGNQGMRDQVMAMKWIQKNIHHFGGDRGRVTLFGNSFGGIHVTNHLISPMSKGLFHQAIAQSGTVLMPVSYSTKTQETAFNFGSLFNCTGPSTSELVQCLREIDAGEAVLAAARFQETTPSLLFTYSVEPILNGSTEDTILPDYPLTLLEQGQMADVPLIIGVNSGEALGNALIYLTNPELIEQINLDWLSIAGAEMNLDYTSDPVGIGNSAKNHYFGDQLIGRDTRKNLTDIFSDRRYVHPALLLASFSKNDNIYLYYFDRKVPRKYTAAIEPIYGCDEWLGASHADELQLLFPYDDYPYIPVDSEYSFISATIVQYWTSFATNGTPTLDWIPNKSNEFPKKWYRLDDSPKMTIELEERLAFWDGYNYTDLYLLEQVEFKKQM